MRALPAGSAPTSRRRRARCAREFAAPPREQGHAPGPVRPERAYESTCGPRRVGDALDEHHDCACAVRARRLAQPRDAFPRRRHGHEARGLARVKAAPDSGVSKSPRASPSTVPGQNTGGRERDRAELTMVVKSVNRAQQLGHRRCEVGLVEHDENRTASAPERDRYRRAPADCRDAAAPTTTGASGAARAAPRSAPPTSPARVRHRCAAVRAGP